MPKSTKRSSKPKVSKAELAAKKAAIEQLKNTRDYSELAGLLAQAAYKKVATAGWINKHLPKGESSLEKVTAKEKERFILALIRAGAARKVIDDLRDLPSREYKTIFAELASLSPAKATEKLKALPTTRFVQFCAVNEIDPVRSGAKKSISRAKTIPFALEKLKRLSEYLRL